MNADNTSDPHLPLSNANLRLQPHQTTMMPLHESAAAKRPSTNDRGDAQPDANVVQQMR